ncbi:aminotransferase class III-fold pyridoxal phosphate-dependent enzyme [bacterium]|nr:aminotransferase class III-fold pyridoxal phosphate-dependent enzyme [bacterium]
MNRFPGPQSAALLDELSRYVIAQPWPFALDLARGHGMYLVTVDGQEIFDWAGYFGAKLIAHNDPRMSEPGYVARLVAAANNKTANPDFLTPECVAYYRLLHEIAPRCMRNPKLEVYVVNSGAEAVENMMKYFIHLHDEREAREGRSDGPRRFLYFDQAFHGRTVFALNVTRLSHDPVATRGFQGLFAQNVQAEFPAVDADAPAEENRRRAEVSIAAIRALFKERAREICGVIVEPIQGAGGHRIADPWFFRELSSLANEYGVFLGFDEVQTAGGQTGDVFAVDRLDLPHPPQAVAVGKKFGNGAVYMREPMDDRNVLDSTWGGTLADMVRFVAEWEIVRDERLIEKVADKEAHLVARLRDLAATHPSLIRNIRGMGVYQGFTVATPDLRSRLIQTALQDESLLLLSAGADTIRLRPHLHATHEDIDRLAEKLDRSLTRAIADSAGADR